MKLKEIFGILIGGLIALIIFFGQSFIEPGINTVIFGLSLFSVILVSVIVIIIYQKFGEINYLKDSFEKFNEEFIKRNKEIEDKFKIYERLSQLEAKIK